MATLDNSGQYRRDLGWKRTESGKRSQQRFYLGHDQDTAEFSEQRLVKFWTAYERYFEIERDGEVCFWEDWSLEIAKQIAAGKVVAQASIPANVQHFVDEGGLTVVAGWLYILKKYFGTICGMELEESKQAEEAQIKRGEFHVEMGKMILATTGKPSTGETLHGAIDAYTAYLHQVHQTAEKLISQTGKKQGERAIRLKQHHPDFPLYDLTSPKIEEILHYWGKRPFYGEAKAGDMKAVAAGKKAKRFSRTTCKNQMILIRSFLRWLHRSEMQWHLPANHLFPRVKIEWLPSEVSGEVKKRTFTIKEVGLLWKHATAQERVFIALGINCGFGVGEIGTLADSEIQGKLIKRLRHKTKVFGCWWLFPITRDAIAWAKKRKEVMGFESDFLLITDSGQPYSTVTKGNNNTQKVRNSWLRLLKRVRKEQADFPKLSFGKLRKTAASWMRRVGGGEMSSIFIAHGKATEDGLLDLYANRQFRKLFKCQKRIWKQLSSVMNGEFTEPKKRKPSSVRLEESLKRRILKLKQQGYRHSAIAEKTKANLTTIRRVVDANTNSIPLPPVAEGQK